MYSGLSIDLSRMDKIITIHDEDMDVVVPLGVNWVKLNDKLKTTSLFRPLDPSPMPHIEMEGVKKCFKTLGDHALEMDGTVSGEHSNELGKNHCLEKELGPVTIDVMRAFKRSWAAGVAESWEHLGFMSCFV
ncbi:hypothetical protein PEBR_35609 [Penicillium brasilianum]|uniref:Uncharacterized protein n=1 Tax=Penicillium brasilianum TaxID=104259 RepID=A0A1S9RDN3_PENBI|nr:hypothetical protein PEBR_35609 [Penicillium brasilianum]